MKISSSEIAKITGGRLEGDPGIDVVDIFTDSRQFLLSGEAAYVAIKGKNHNGHMFVEELYRRGIRVFIVGHIPSGIVNYPGSAFIVTGNTVEALHKIAAFRRSQFKGIVIAVTGSAGKTIVKEWLADVMGIGNSVIRSPKSYNSQIGVPLSVLKLDEKYDTAIFEAGISMSGEMEKLQKIIDPHIGVLTNIGDAHQENFPDLRTKAAEKLKLFTGASTIIYCSDNRVVSDLIVNDTVMASRRLVNWSFTDEKAAIFVKEKISAGGRTSVEMIFERRAYRFDIPFTDRASVENALTVIAVCLSSGTGYDNIRKGIAGLVSVAMRMEMKNGINNCILIDDYYNSDPGSLVMAVDYLKSQNNRKTTLILSDFIQSGRDERELYGDVASLAARTGISRFIGIGESLSRNSDLFGANSSFYASTGDFISDFRPSDFRNEAILLKGARIYEFERISRLLELQVHQTVLEINLDALIHNLNEFRRHLGRDTRIMAMVKAFAYGAGASEIAGLLEYHRVDYLAVAYADEGVELRKAGISLPVMVMNPELSAFETMISYDLEPELFSIGSFRQFADIASRHGLIQYPVHIKIDTGMHRLGFMPGETEELSLLISKTECVKVISVFSHLSASEDPSLDYFSHRQVSLFTSVAAALEKAAGYPFLKHILNSSGIARFPMYQFDMVRPGIGLYGVGGLKGFNLRVVGRFKTRISQVKKIPGGEPVGYGCSDVSESERLIAILPVGYADGLNRRLGNGNGSLFIKGRRVPVTGNICMDMCMADVTGLDVIEGEDAEIFGENIPVEELASKCGTIPYEILTSVPGRVKRIFFRE